MGYIIRRLHRLKKEAKYKVIKQQADEPDEVKAKRTTLKKAIYQRAILTTIDQVKPHLRKDGPKEYLKKLQNPNYKERKPNKDRPHDVDRVVPPPHEVGKADYEEEDKPKEEEKPKEKPQEEKPQEEYKLPSQEQIDTIIETMKDAKIKAEGTSVKKEQDALRNLSPLSNQEKKWMATAAWQQLNFAKEPSKHYELSAAQIARYNAWVIRLKHNKQDAPSSVKELEKYRAKHGEDVS